MTGLETVAGLRTGLLSRREKRRLPRANLLLLGASALGVLAATCGYGGAAGAAPALKVLYTFSNLRGTDPDAGLIADKAGNFYGTTSTGGLNNEGVAYELSPPAVGKKKWTETVIKSFNGTTNGSQPYGNLIADAAGNLYGTAQLGGASNDGVAFELSPPTGGKKKWTETVLHSFNGTDGANPEWSLLADKAGNLYGTAPGGGASNDGVVYELSPPAVGKKAWTETVLLNFNGANGYYPFFAGLTADSSGNLYGTTIYGGVNPNCTNTSGCGAVFELSPPTLGQTAWTETVLNSFSGGKDGGYPVAGVLLDGAGNLYGTSSFGGISNYGNVFELSPPKPGNTAWTEKVLFLFDGNDGQDSYAALIADGAGNLYGTTLQGGNDSNGVVYELSPPTEGEKKWTETVLERFPGNEGHGPVGSLFRDGAGKLYGTTYAGGVNQDGNVFEITP